MPRPNADPRDRWIALGVLAGVAALAWLLAVDPWWGAPLRAVDARIGSLQQRELRMRMQLQQAPQVAQGLERARALAARSPGFLPEASAELATAGLVRRLETVVEQASPGNRSCAISNRAPLADTTPAGRFPRVTVQVRLRCGAPELARVLHALESGSPRLFVGNLSVSAQRYFFAPGRGAQQGGLEVGFDLSGYLLPPARLAVAKPVAAATGGNDAP
jgi:general secretion pathway protein M